MEDLLGVVHWDVLEGPYGPAADVPGLLRALRDDDPARRARAERELRDHLQQQGAIYPPGAAAAPLLIGQLSDTAVPDRLVVYRLLQMIVDCVQLWDPPDEVAGPTLADLAFARSEWWVSRSAAWQRAGDIQRPTTSADDAAAYEAVRAGIPTYLTLLRDDDPDLRIGMASLLGSFPSEWGAMSTAMADQLITEQVPEVAAAICLAVGRAGQPCGDRIVEAVSRWRAHADPFVHRCALIGLGRVHANPDTALLAELADCLIIRLPEEDLLPQEEDLTSPLTMANAAAWALGGRRPAEVAHLAGPLLARLRIQQDDQSDFLALRLLLGVAFPDGPLPEHTRFVDLNGLQQRVVQLVRDTEQLDRGVLEQRLVGECNLPYTQQELATWATTQPPLR